MREKCASTACVCFIVFNPIKERLVWNRKSGKKYQEYIPQNRFSEQVIRWKFVKKSAVSVVRFISPKNNNNNKETKSVNQEW